MQILVDISHPAHVNFFKNAIKQLKQKGNYINITALERGELPRILKEEFRNYDIKLVGQHKGTTISIIFNANIKKFINLFFFSKKRKIDIGISVGGFPLGAALKLLRKPNIQFDDDPESKKNFFLEKLTATELYFPPLVNAKGKTKIMNALKEWAYLSSKYFNPQESELKKHNLLPNNYFFIREVSTKSFNYLQQKSNVVATFAKKLQRNYKVLLSLEDKTTIDEYPSDWILLKEPVKDIHSLMFYSKIVISSGDSMAREGAMLGVPSIYCGVRDMRANKIMIEKGMLFKINPNEVPDFVTKILSGEMIFEDQAIFRKNLLGEWDDVTEFIIKQIKKYERRD